MLPILVVRVIGQRPEYFVICRVNDWVENPDVIVDLSSKVFGILAPLYKGILDVEIEVQ